MFKARILPAPPLQEDGYPDLPSPRTDDWASRVRGTDARLGDERDEAGEDQSGGLEQVRHPAPEVEHAAPIDLTPPDPLGLGDDDADAAADKRAMDQAQALAASRSVYAIDSGSGRPDELELDF